MTKLTRAAFDGICSKIVAHMNVLDTDGDGCITKEELKGYFGDNGITPKNVAELLKNFDDSTDMAGFVHLLVDAFPCTPEMRLFIFHLDKETGNFSTETLEDDVKDGYISLDELKAFVVKNRNVLKNLKTPQDCTAAFNKLDTDGDGKLNPVEAASLLQNGKPTHLFGMLKPLANVIYSMDTDGSGNIQIDEAIVLLGSMGISREIMDDVISKRKSYGRPTMKFITFMHFCLDVFISSQGQ